MIKNDEFVTYLKKMFPNAVCELNFNSNFELLIAVILSAQCTDKRVNMVTKELFKKYNTPKQFAELSLEEIEKLIHSCGFYHNKAKSIKNASISILNNFGGEVPQDYNSLLSLAGVGRKTANVVSSVAFKANVIAVDTHVLRVSNRLGFTKSLNPNICEKDLTKRFKTELDDLHYRMVLFGRYHCKAQKPLCQLCEIKQHCKYYLKEHNN